MKKIKNTKGFTLMEMLIVVAIIAILIAIAIPTFTKQLEKAREATDIANIRSAYSEAMVKYLNNEKDASAKSQPMTQKEDEWQTTGIWPNYLNDGKAVSVKNGDVVTVTIKADGTNTVSADGTAPSTNPGTPSAGGAGGAGSADAGSDAGKGGQ